MFRRTLIFAAACAVFVGAITIILAILDIISFQVLRQNLRKLLAVIAVSAIAILLLQKLFWLATQGSPEKHITLQPPGPMPTKEDEVKKHNKEQS
jgi:uncharacterized membrane protein